MTYEIYRYIFIGGAILSGIMLVVTVIAFFALKIPTVIGDLTGSNARKAIERIRDQNERTKDGAQDARSPYERSELTDKISRSGRIIPKTSSGARPTPPTGAAVNTQQLPINGKAAETTVLSSASQETTVLGGATSANETTVLGNATYANETTVLGNATYANETTVLNSGMNVGTAPAVAPQPANTPFVIEYELTFIHTDEIIY